MKYGDYFERESVARWSLHNIDYNTLKQLIKVNTTKNQAASAIAIPGQTDFSLKRFEDTLYHELLLQHSRVDLFVSGKADEIARRLRHLHGLVHILILKCTDSNGVNSRRQKRFVKYRRQIDECANDIDDLKRFVWAQKEALRKILKKYKKWTGSTSLGARFRDTVLSNLKSFTKRDFHPLEQQHQELLTTLRAASPPMQSPHQREDTSTSRRTSRLPSPATQPSAPSKPPAEPETRYWNEYDNGSEVGDEEYTLYINPDESGSFPGLGSMKGMFNGSARKIRGWLGQSDKDAEHQSLLHAQNSPTDYFSIRNSAHNTDNEATEDEDSSSVEYPIRGYTAHYAALPSIEDQRVARFREKVMHRCAIVSFLISIVLLVVAGVLVATGRHKLQVEVDVGVTLAVVVSLFASCTGLGAMLYRQDPLGIIYQSVIWITFIGICVLNGMLLVLVAGVSGL
ncbi:spx domain-containing protein [Apiospora aurea]|uniref:Spx domain-containing protein n=1 Tax=Apiospora aurea TaxID=335848 RepID=A0ABR1QEY8_9PEZI